ncbi:MAG: Wzz/FepE/Etk N-terminal domain-containing protein [Steroidobacteraceae bacterium]
MSGASFKPVSDETTLRGLVEVLWKSRWLVVSITAAFIVVIAAIAFSLPRQYVATVVLAPANNRSGNGFGLGLASSALSEIGGLASLANIQLPGSTDREVALETLKSDVLARDYIEQHKLRPVLFHDTWDAARGRWKVTDSKDIPTLWQATQKFAGRVRNVSEDTRSGLITLTITWTDPRIAAEWANGLVKLANDYLRDKAIRRSERNIAYLNQQASKTDVAQIRAALYTILESELRNEMLARGTDEYALNVLDPAVAPERPSYPRRMVWLLAAALSGFFVAVFVALARKAWQDSASEEPAHPDKPVARAVADLR